MKSIQALREERQKLAAELRTIMDSTAGKEWSNDDQAKYDGLVASVDKIDAEIQRIEKALDIENASNQRVENRVNDLGISADEAQNAIETEKSVFNTFLRQGREGLNMAQRQFIQNRIQNAQSTGTNSEGGFIVPTDFATTLLQELKSYGGVRSVANVISTAGGYDMQWPTIDETGNKGELVAENASVSSEDLTFGSKTLGAYKYSSKSIAVPFELLQDNNVDLEGYILSALGERISRITNEHFTTGNGSSKPSGIAIGAGTGATAAGASAITLDDLIELEHSVDPAYRALGASYMFNDNTLKLVRKLKDADGRPLWNPSLVSGEPDRIGRYGYVVNQDMADATTGNRSVIFGNFQNYMIRDVMNVTLFRMTDSKYTEKGQVGFLAFSRHDGALMDASGSSVKALTQA
jgi:HK97 family phage major capsid protein